MRTKIFKETRCGYFDLLVVKGTERFNGKRFFPVSLTIFKNRDLRQSTNFSSKRAFNTAWTKPETILQCLLMAGMKWSVEEPAIFFRAFLIFMLFLIFAHYMRIVPSDSFSPLDGLCEHPNIIIPVISRNFSDYINVPFQQIRRSAENLFRFCAEDFTRQALSSNK